MRLMEIAREGLRDVGTGAAAPTWFALAMAVAVGLPSVVGAAQTTADIKSARDWVAAGAATWVEEAEGRIDGPACDALVAIPSVRAAGAIRQAGDDLEPTTLPRSTIPTFETTAGFDGVAGAKPVTAVGGAAISASVADRLGAVPGTALETSDGPAWIRAVYDSPDDGRSPTIAHAALLRSPEDDTPFDACWATVWPADSTPIVALGRTVGGAVADSDGTDGNRPRLAQLNGSLGRERPSIGFVPDGVRAAASAIACVAIGFRSVRRRRLAIASNRHIGVSMSAQLAIELTQTIVWTTCGGSAAFAAVVLATNGLSASDVGVVRGAGLVLVAFGAAAALLGAVVGVLATRERSLFRYFKHR